MLLFAPYLIFFRETWQTFLQFFSHHQLVNSFDCWQFVVNASRINQSYFALWGQRIFHWVWLCEQSLFFLLGLPPSFLASRGFAAQPSRASAPLTKSEEKERLLAFYLERYVAFYFISPETLSKPRKIKEMVCPEQFTSPAMSSAERLPSSPCRKVLYTTCR